MRDLPALPVSALVDTGAHGRRHSFGGAFVLGDEVLIGAIALEDMDLVISPALCEVTVNPASPHVARGCACGHSESAAGANARKQRT